MRNRILVLCLLAFGLRVVGVAAHLAFEHHHEGNPAHAQVAHHGHDDHEHSPHDSHPASDHGADLVARASSIGLVVLCTPLADEPSFAVPTLLTRLAPGPRVPVPRGRPPGSARTRAPPSC